MNIYGENHRTATLGILQKELDRVGINPTSAQEIALPPSGFIVDGLLTSRHTSTLDVMAYAHNGAQLLQKPGRPGPAAVRLDEGRNGRVRLVATPSTEGNCRELRTHPGSSLKVVGDVALSLTAPQSDDFVRMLHAQTETPTDFGSFTFSVALDTAEQVWGVGWLCAQAMNLPPETTEAYMDHLRFALGETAALVMPDPQIMKRIGALSIDATPEM